MPLSCYHPAYPDYTSLNLAMSVQILAYEVRMAMLAKSHDAVDMPTENKSDQDYPLMADLEHFIGILSRHCGRRVFYSFGASR